MFVVHRQKNLADNSRNSKQNIKKQNHEKRRLVPFPRFNFNSQKITRDKKKSSPAGKKSRDRHSEFEVSIARTRKKIAQQCLKRSKKMIEAVLKELLKSKS